MRRVRYERDIAHIHTCKYNTNFTADAFNDTPTIIVLATKPSKPIQSGTEVCAWECSKANTKRARSAFVFTLPYDILLPLGGGAGSSEVACHLLVDRPLLSTSQMRHLLRHFISFFFMFFYSCKSKYRGMGARVYCFYCYFNYRLAFTFTANLIDLLLMSTTS